MSKMADRGMTVRAAYADPPYLGCAARHYALHHEKANDYDDPDTHRRLIERLSDEFDCWALSLHEPSLRVILPMCPTDTRVAAWVKPFAAFKRNVTRAWTWEPVIFRFSPDRPRSVEMDTWRDHVSAPIAMRKGFPGAKPQAFSFWVFEGLNLLPGDSLVDLFPGSGAVSEAWERWNGREVTAQMKISDLTTHASTAEPCLPTGSVAAGSVTGPKPGTAGVRSPDGD